MTENTTNVEIRMSQAEVEAMGDAEAVAPEVLEQFIQDYNKKVAELSLRVFKTVEESLIETLEDGTPKYSAVQVASAVIRVGADLAASASVGFNMDGAQREAALDALIHDMRERHNETVAHLFGREEKADAETEVVNG